jgi:amidase
MSTTDICFMTAIELAGRLRRKDLSAREVLAAHLERIDRVNPRVNAIVTLERERALRLAAAADERLARGETPGPLHGLPIAHKDLFETSGVRTTFGSRVFERYVPARDALPVERAARAGAIAIGKTNTPEFGAGSQTFNEVFGATLNPYDVTKTCGGSSGGAAVALACGMVPLADGSDLGGSLRNPAAFCNVVGFRPSPGRVPSWPSRLPWFDMPVDGPLGRTVEDVALLLSVMAGPDPRAPLSLPEPGSAFARPLARRFEGVRVAWSRDLGGLPVDARVTSCLEARRPVLESIGCEVVDADLDFSGADDAFRAWRAWATEASCAALGLEPRDLKDTLAAELEDGRRLTGAALARAQMRRAELYGRFAAFMGQHEFMIAPVAQVPPFDVREPWVKAIGAARLDSYIDWMRSCYYVSVLAAPAISVPAGFTPQGLPVGMQIVGRPRDDFGVLQLAHAFEQATGWGERRPPVVDER